MGLEIGLFLAQEERDGFVANRVFRIHSHIRFDCQWTTVRPWRGAGKLQPGACPVQRMEAWRGLKIALLDVTKGSKDGAMVLVYSARAHVCS
jgi:hypothetical protein